MLDNLLINSIYKATEGEGIHLGTPQVFVRFQGCAIACINCDSVDTWEFEKSDAQMMSLESVLDEIVKEGGAHLKRVSITGGDPLHPRNTPGVLALTKALKERGFYVNLEAAGTRVVDEIFDLLDFVGFDFKTPSTGVKTNSKLILKLLEQYQGRFQIKAVIEDKKDFDAYYDIYNEVLAQTNSPMGQWCITPCYNLREDFPLERFQNCIDWNELNGGLFRVIGQQHKWLHGPDKKQV